MQKPIVIAICNRKGGTGKTNIAVNLPAFLAYFGKKVLLIDLDPQSNASSGLGQENNDKGIYEVLSKEISLGASMNEVLPNFWLSPATPNLVGADIELVNADNRESILSQVVKSFFNNTENEFDFVFIDTPPSFGLITLNAMVAADEILIPVQTEYYALEGLTQLIQSINLIKQELKPDLSIMGAVLTMYDKRNKLSYDVWQELYKNFPYKIFRTVIPRNTSLAEAPSHSKTILEHAPKSKGANAYKRLAKEILFEHKNF
ncbi:AAA family ATPase [Patescibacteria group bacterium]|nr:AAA family ATPase [Patescibacteria group bacterium]